jgi:hypothetical protein
VFIHLKKKKKKNIFTETIASVLLPRLLQWIHSVLANKLSLALKVIGKVTDSDMFDVFSVSILVIMLPAIWRMVNFFFETHRLMLFLLYAKMVYYELFYLCT